MKTEWMAKESWWKTLDVDDRGIWTINDRRCAVGIVIFVTSGEKMVLIRKAEKPEYEFSGCFALPGGLVRGTTEEGFVKSLEHSLYDRVKRECGLTAYQLKNVEYLYDGPSPVSGYFAKGQQRSTMVLVARANTFSDYALKFGDTSVNQAVWCSFPPAWEQIAPANRLILARIFACRMSRADKRAAFVHIEDAVDKCNRLATEVGLRHVENPWL